MITEQIKAMAIAKLKINETPEEVAESLELPLALVNEWASKLTMNDLVHLNANMFALQKMTADTVMPTSACQEELLKSKIEQVAIEIVDQVSLTVMTGDIIHAKAVQICADTITKLYTVLIAKAEMPNQPSRPNGTTITLFQDIMKD